MIRRWRPRSNRHRGHPNRPYNNLGCYPFEVVAVERKQVVVAVGSIVVVVVVGSNLEEVVVGSTPEEVVVAVAG